jgi:hypothetical protein
VPMMPGEEGGAVGCRTGGRVRRRQTESDRLGEDRGQGATVVDKMRRQTDGDGGVAQVQRQGRWQITGCPAVLDIGPWFSVMRSTSEANDKWTSLARQPQVRCVGLIAE